MEGIIERRAFLCVRVSFSSPSSKYLPLSSLGPTFKKQNACVWWNHHGKITTEPSRGVSGVVSVVGIVW